jgi:aspartate aminotransferase, cytoplasmic
MTFRAKGHFAFLDAAYLGFATRSPYKDTESIRVFSDAGVPLLVAATYGKAFGLYGERVGILCVVAPELDVATRIEKQMKLQARAETGAMPTFGARIVELVLGDAGLREMWEKDMEGMAGELEERRLALREHLEAWDTPGNWNYITEQVGLFS